MPTVDIKESFVFGFKQAKNNIWYFIKVFAFIVIAQGLLILIISTFRDSKSSSNILILSLVQIVVIAVQVIVQMGLISSMLMIVDGKKPEFMDIFKTVKPFWRYVVVLFATRIFVMLGMIVLIVPGIILLITLFFSKYLVVDQDLGMSDAIKRSWQITRGAWGSLFLFWIIIILFNLAGYFLFFVGLLVTIPITWITMAYIYRSLLDQSDLESLGKSSDEGDRKVKNEDGIESKEKGDKEKDLFLEATPEA